MESNHIVQARKERGWSQLQLLRQLRIAAGAAGVVLPDDATLRISLSGWENGHHKPGPMYRRLLAAVLEMTDSDLGFEPRHADRQTQIGAEALDYLGAMFRLHAKADQELGSRILLHVVREQTHQAEAWLKDARGPLRDALLRQVSRYAELCGWLHQDQGDWSNADHWTCRAIEMSQEIGDQRHLSYALMRRSNIATESGRAIDGLHLAEAALRQAAGNRLAPEVVALSLRQKAAAHALLGETSDCQRATEGGMEAAQRVPEIPVSEADYCTVSYIAMEGGHAMMMLGQPARAVQLLSDALKGWPNAQHRDQGLCWARLANAYAEVGDVAASCQAGHTAFDAVISAPSARTATSLRHLRGRLTKHRRRPDVLDLRERLAKAV